MIPQQLEFQQHFTSALDGEPGESTVARQVHDAMWSKVPPVKSTSPHLIAWVPEMAAALGIDIDADKAAAAEVFTGTSTPAGTLPYAMRYGGHQFGNWAGQLGDGRAIALGELPDLQGKLWTLQLKGAGPTPYSRQGDGYAVLRSSIREYLCAEAMHHLGIPTTRSLTLCLTGESIERDIFYNGHVEQEPGAIVCRAAESFIRFGSFEIHAAHREINQLQRLADFVIKEHYPHLWNGAATIDTYQQWFAELLQRTAYLVAHWQRVGFVHAVMNTDNMSIVGQTIDYGPYGWLEEFDQTWTPNFVDQQGRRYCYGNQPQIALWNLYRLANAILPLFNDETKPLEEVLQTYDSLFDTYWNTIRANKVGLDTHNAHSQDTALLDSLWALLENTSPDYTVFFSTLSACDKTADPQHIASQLIDAAYYQPVDDSARQSLTDWLATWTRRLATKDSNTVNQLMKDTNPKFVLRNHIAIEAIDAAEKGDYSVLHRVADMITRPYDDQPQNSEYALLRPDWAKSRPGCTMLTCSS
ncbi:MAG: YdiU family protein [Pseudomonadota bacterium]